MRSRIAVLGFILAVASIHSVCPGKQASTTQLCSGPVVNGVIATHDLVTGTLITNEDINEAPRVDVLPRGCRLTKAEVAGLRVVLTTPKGAVVCASNVSSVEETRFDTPMMRAVWVSVRNVRDATLLEPGNRVDVLADRSAIGVAEHGTKTLKQLLVLAVDLGGRDRCLRVTRAGDTTLLPD
jgi:Flp pilus assembly protein CpaB